MNLKRSHLPVLVGGALTGAASGYLLCVVARVFFPHVEDLPALGLVFGALVGIAIVIFGVIVAASRNRDAEVPAQFTSINGIGSTLYGRADRHDDGSYITTEWFTFCFVPILPICSYRVIRISATIISSHYRILDRFPPRTSHLVKGYAVTAVVVSFIVLFALYVRN